MCVVVISEEEGEVGICGPVPSRLMEFVQTSMCNNYGVLGAEVEETYVGTAMKWVVYWPAVMKKGRLLL